MGMPGLRAATNSATSGLTVTQQKMVDISNNTSNVGVPGYSKQTTSTSSSVLNGQTVGVISNATTRLSDPQASKALWHMTGEHQRAFVEASIQKDLSSHLGNPTEAKALTNALGDFKDAMVRLSSQPSEGGLQSTVVAKGVAVARKIKGMAELVQTLRTKADTAIAGSVEKINSLTEELAKLNRQIRTLTNTGGSSPALEDERDRVIGELSEHINFNVDKDRDNVLQLFVGGTMLVGTDAFAMNYTPATAATPSTTFGDITLGGIPITNSITAGKIKGNIDQRDISLPQLQEQLDELTMQIRDSVNAISNLGSAFAPPNSLTSSRTFAAGTDAFAGTGTLRIAVIDTTAGNVSTYVAPPLDLDLTTVTTIDELVTAIDTGLGANGSAAYDAATGKITIQATNAAHGIALGSQDNPVETGTGLNALHFFGFNDFFETGDRVAGSSNVGIANVLSVAQPMVANPYLFPISTLDTTAAPLANDPALYPGDTSNLMRLLDVMSEDRTFNTAGGMSVSAMTLQDYGSTIIGNLAEKGKLTTQEAEALNLIVTSLERSLRDATGVNLEEELKSAGFQAVSSTVLTRILGIILDMYRQLADLGR